MSPFGDRKKVIKLFGNQLRRCSEVIIRSKMYAKSAAELEWYHNASTDCSMYLWLLSSPGISEYGVNKYFTSGQHPEPTRPDTVTRQQRCFCTLGSPAVTTAVKLVEFAAPWSCVRRYHKGNSLKQSLTNLTPLCRSTGCCELFGRGSSPRATSETKRRIDYHRSTTSLALCDSF